ncbi:hypothetical protein E2C01_094548 [Portunus trituberculatus]|uniref:Uncharacterized protein n=1 Tax=Portunus trituberculatus TaxID=210409 RepID=A0A5B7JSN9_PORTR|nr:hypothetical protein [Portunus trituberculatus]
MEKKIIKCLHSGSRHPIGRPASRGSQSAKRRA